MSANKLIFQEGINIGQNGAEHDDHFLFKCFVDHPAYAQITDIDNPSTFLLGSTGIGKTAIIRMVEKQEENSVRVEVHDLAMNHIANSDTILFLQTLDIDLTLFFQALWRHVFCVEYIKLAVQASDRAQFQFKISRLLGAAKRSQHRRKLEEFVEKHSNQFWNTIDENVIELTDSLNREFSAQFGADFKKFNTRAGYLHNLGSQQKVQLQQRAKKFLNDATLSELPGVISALSDYTQGRQDKFYLTVDGLDEHWVDDGIKFHLLQALFESLKSLKKLRNFQVIVALRNDLYARMVEETPSAQRQIEKYEDLILRIKWSKEQLRRLADRRIRELFRWKYSSQDVSFDDVFKQRPDARNSPWDYIFERTLNRPRDVINFINMALQESEGKSAVSKTSFLRGEANYSNLRLETLIHEWSGTFPAISVMLELLRDKPAYRSSSEFMHSKFIEQLYDELGKESYLQKDQIWKRLEAYVSGQSSLEPVELVQITLHRLHLIGAVGLKTRESRPWDWISQSTRPVPGELINSDTRFQVHPMLFASLGTRPWIKKEKE